MNAGVSSEKEKVKESQSQKCGTPARHPLGVPAGGFTPKVLYSTEVL